MLLVTKNSKPQGQPLKSQMSCSKLGLSSEGNRSVSLFAAVAALPLGWVEGEEKTWSENWE